MSSMVEHFAKSLTLDSFKSAKDLKQRLLFTFLLLIVFRIGTYIPLPGINPEALIGFIKSNSSGVLGVLDMFSGGALGRMTIFTLSITPYISSSIIMQLLATMYPPFQALKKEGELGRKKINRYTRYLTVIISCLQGVGAALFVETMGHDSIIINPWLFKVVTVLTLTGGTLFVMWLGEQITSRGIGNGVSLIIYSGIIANIPVKLVNAFTIGREEGIYYVVPLVIGVAALVFGYVVFVEKAQRRVPIQYPRRNVSQGPSSNMPNHMPLKVNMAGVMPPIFAQSIMILPITMIGYSFASSEHMSTLMTIMRPGHPIYTTLFVSLVVFFAFFYTNLMFNTDETAENLKKSQAYIPGIRPGVQTSQYLKFIIMRLTVIGAIYLVTICIIPQLILQHMPVDFYFGGTSILIVVSVTIDTISQIQTYLFAHQYKGLVSHMKKRMK